MSLSVYHHHCRFHAGRVISESVNRRTGVCLSVCQSRGCRGYNSTLRRRYLPIYRVYCGGKTQPAAMQILKRDSLAVNAASVRFGLLYEGCARRGYRKPWFSVQNIKKLPLYCCHRCRVEAFGSGSWSILLIPSSRDDVLIYKVINEDPVAS